MARNDHLLLIIIAIIFGAVAWPLFSANTYLNINAVQLQNLFCKVVVDNIVTGIAICHNSNDTLHLVQGPGILLDVNSVTNQINITSVGGVDNHGTNVGSGAQVYKTYIAPNLVFRTLSNGSGVNVFQHANDITFSLGIKVNNVTAGTNQALVSYDNVTGNFIKDSFLKSLNGDTSGAQTVQGTAGHIKVTNAGAIHTVDTLFKINNSTCPSGMFSSYDNVTGNFGCTMSSGGITTINGDNTAAQIIQGQAGNTTVSSAAGTTTIGLGTNPVITGGATQTISKQIITNNLKLGGNENANSFKITNLNNATLPNDAVNARQLGLLGNMTYGNKCSDTQILSYQASNQTWICSNASSVNQNQPAVYLIYTSGGTIYAKKQSTGSIDYSGTDAHTIIEDAINATVSQGGGRVEIKDGIYHISKGIRIQSNIHIYGESWSTLLSLDNNAKDSVIKTLATNQANMTVYNMQIYGNYANQGALYPTNNYIGVDFEGCDTCTIDHVWVHDTNGMGIVSSSGEPNEHQAVTNSFVKHTVGDGIFFQAKRAIASNNRIEQQGDYGIVVEGNALVIANNVIYGDSHNWGNGEGIGINRGSNNTVVVGNTIVNAKNRGIVIGAFGAGNDHGCDVCSITGNTITNSTSDGIFISGSVAHDNSTNIVISSNVLKGNHGNGIRVTGGKFIAITSNVVDHNYQNGIITFGSNSNETLISSNIIRDNSQLTPNFYDGINRGGSTPHGNNTMITSNYVFDDQSTPTQRYGIKNDAGSASNSFVTNNVVWGNISGQIANFANIVGNYQNGVLDPGSAPAELDSSTYRLFEQTNIMRLLRTAANSSNTFFIIPSGTSTRSVVQIFGNSSTNSDSLNIIADGTLGHEITVSAAGTGKLDPLRIKMGSHSEILFNTDNSINFLNNLISAPQILDNGFNILDDVDTTKKFTFEVSGIITAHTQTYTAPNKNGTLALTSDLLNTAQIGNADGATVGLFSSRPNATQNLIKTLTGSNGITFVTNSTDVKINQERFQNNTGTNLGTANGLGIYTSNSGSALQFRSITCGSNLQCSTNSTNLRINATAGNGITSINSDSTAAQLITANSIQSNLTVTDSSNTHKIGLGKSVVVLNGTQQNFTKIIWFMPPNATRAGINIGTTSGTPSNLQNGDCWLNTANWLNCRISGITKAFGTISSGNTWSGTQTYGSGATLQLGTSGVIKIGSGNTVFRGSDAKFATSLANSAQTANNTITIPVLPSTANNIISFQPRYNFTSPANQTGTTSLTPVMLGGFVTYTPRYSANATATISGYAIDSLLGDGCRIDVRYGTSNLGANGAAVSGTLVGTNQKMTSGVASGFVPFSKSVTFNNVFTPGTKYYIDLSFAAITGGTCTIYNTDWQVREQ